VSSDGSLTRLKVASDRTNDTTWMWWLAAATQVRESVCGALPRQEGLSATVLVSKVRGIGVAIFERNLPHGGGNGSLGVLDRDYSALCASPFAMLRAALSGVLQRVASQSGRRTGVTPLGRRCRARAG
jgi:hypothetical protein